METSNMFTVYRNSLKNNVNNNSNAFVAEQQQQQNAFIGGHPQAPQNFSEPHSKQGTAGLGGATAQQHHLYQTAR